MVEATAVAMAVKHATPLAITATVAKLAIGTAKVAILANHVNHAKAVRAATAAIMAATAVKVARLAMMAATPMIAIVAKVAKVMNALPGTETAAAAGTAPVVTPARLTIVRLQRIIQKCLLEPPLEMPQFPQCGIVTATATVGRQERLSTWMARV